MRKPRSSKSEFSTSMDFKNGAVVEVLSEQGEYHGGWFQATVVKKLGFQQYVVRYKNFVLPKGDGKNAFFTEKASVEFLRPKPPALQRHNSFTAGEYVEVFHQLGWFKAVVLQIIPSRRSYSVSLTTGSGAGETKEFPRSKIRACQEWIGGKWVPLQPQPNIKLPGSPETEKSHSGGSGSCSTIPRPAVPSDSEVPDYSEDGNGEACDLVKKRCLEAFRLVFAVFMRRGFPCSAERTELLRRLRTELNISIEEHKRVVKNVLGDIGYSP